MDSNTKMIGQEKQLLHELDKLDETIKQSKSKTGAGVDIKLPKPSVAEKIEKPPPRPPTPSIEDT
jgi:hypothetical protein